MKIAEAAGAGSPAYPHLVVKGARRNQRWQISFQESDGDPHAFPAALLDPRGLLRPDGRIAILKHYARRASAGSRHHCVVWGPTDCTWIDGTGRTRDDGQPPESEPVSVRELNCSPLSIEDAWTIKLPAGSLRGHLAIRTIAQGYVEVTPAEPMHLAHLDEPLEEGESDPAVGMTDARGRLIPPARWRGQPVTGVADGWTLLGPVQPCGKGIVLRDPWPDELFAACDEIAGQRLPATLHDAAWSAYRPERRDLNYVGVLRAA